MIYANIPCPRDGLQGQLEFHYCPKSNKVFFMCDECFSIWLDPNKFDIEEIVIPYIDTEEFGWPKSVGDVFIKELGCSLTESREATEEEIVQYGWGNHIRRSLSDVLENYK